ncbi:uncharacterized protein F4807DRAFT_214339 [Annulohypoxylon truncatum]|uniref:uncharacterized protein n=1 Tax=Annulohypoxylon truncatum TaxID=327061 RepID=UPI0020078D48|nr:uncharacterized protein F4807DRAFT_214339 [Annulohypoxylon truncatum]KAI1206781.1 hypothetical protein F4807DRAFT_214339 [Annulohypoxylon truncatum]
MFASWKPVSNSDGSNALLRKLPHTFDPVTAKTERPLACSQCRAQKVRCTSERNGEGCSRCQTMRRKCTFPPRRRSSAVTGEETPDFTDAETRSDPPELPTPAPTEDSARPASSASANHAAADEWIRESQKGYPHGVDFSNFPLDHEFAQYSGFDLMADCEVQSERLAVEQILVTQEQSLFRGSQHPEIYTSASEQATSPAVPSPSGLPQAEPLFSGEAQTQGSADATRPGGSDCQCLHHVVVLMDELELLGEPTQAHLPVDGILVVHRKALRQAESMLACASCATRVDHMIILTFLASRLADLCCRAASALSSRCATYHPGINEAPATSMGEYRLESETEYIAVARVLLQLGLDGLIGLVSALQEAGRRLGSETMGRRLGVCRRAIELMLDGI